MKLRVLKDDYSVLRYFPGTPMPKEAKKSAFYSFTVTEKESSLVCETKYVEPGYQFEEAAWKVLKVEGTLDFTLVGILSSIATPLAEANVSIFALSTFDTDHILLKSKDLQKALDTLKESGFTIVDSNND